MADLVDNSISAGATEVRVDLRFDGISSWIRIADNGRGMDAATLTESLRYGSERAYDTDDLGKFGFGLKSASTSQCRRVVVASRRAQQRVRVEARALDLEHIERTNRWEVLIVEPAERPGHLVEPLQQGTGTVVLWEDLDQVLDYKDPFGGWAKKRLLERAEAIAEHLGMVFHRFITGEAPGPKLRLFVNESQIDPWDPFCRDETATVELPLHDFPVPSDNGMGVVRVRPYVLPNQAEFSDTAAWQRASGPLKWNRQQGLYIYRSNRLIQWGGWSRIRTIDEHTKLARVAVDFSSNLDAAFGVNISKAIVKLPPDLRDHLEPVLSHLLRVAKQRYGSKGAGDRPAPANRSKSASPPPPPPSRGSRPSAQSARASEPTGPEGPPAEGDGLPETPRAAIEAAARAAGEDIALERIVSNLRRLAPEVAHDLGW